MGVEHRRHKAKQYGITNDKVADVKLEYFQKTRIARDSLLNVPVRVVSELGGLVGDITDEQRHDILQLLTKEMNSALEQLAEEDDGTS